MASFQVFDVVAEIMDKVKLFQKRVLTDVPSAWPLLPTQLPTYWGTWTKPRSILRCCSILADTETRKRLVDNSQLYPREHYQRCTTE
jgi:hypothetical protein